MKQRVVLDLESSLAAEREKVKDRDRVLKGALEALKAKADTAYLAYVDKMRSPYCLGQERKLMDGFFGAENIEALEAASRLHGQHLAYSDALASIRALKEGT